MTPPPPPPACRNNVLSNSIIREDRAAEPSAVEMATIDHTTSNDKEVRQSLSNIHAKHLQFQMPNGSSLTVNKEKFNNTHKKHLARSYLPGPVGILVYNNDNILVERMSRDEERLEGKLVQRHGQHVVLARPNKVVHSVS